MQTQPGESLSLWMATADTPRFESLTTDASADVCVIGAGVAGLTTAYLLAGEGLSVVLIDAERLGGRETRHTTSHLVNALDDRFGEIERLHGEHGAKLAVESHSAAIDLIENIIKDQAIDCSFERLDGYLFLPPDGRVSDLKNELEAAQKAGLKQTLLINRAPLESFDTGPALKFPRQAQMHPLRYMSALSLAAKQRGVRICERTRARAIDSGKTARVRTETGHTIRARAVVVATNTPFNDRVVMHTKQAAYRTYVIAGQIPRASVPTALYWDTLDPYHYIRLQNGPDIGDAQHDYLIVGGEDHKTGQDENPGHRFKLLEEWTSARFPMLQNVRYRWSGQILEPIDALAYIGKNPLDEGNVFLITGDSGNGMTHATLGAKLITDLIQGRDNPWAKLYDPSRITLRALGEYAKENLNVAMHYADWLHYSEIHSESELKPGTGGILRDGLKRIAVYRDKNGELTRLSAVCTHLGCVVHWNASEKSWDCPCHGSRYDVSGRVLNGPTATGLKPVTQKKKTERV